jgi:hypothetical protein
MTQDEPEDPQDKHLCFHCVGESYLRAEIGSQGKTDTCSYCGARAKSYGLDELAERIDTVFQEHYIRTSNEPSGWQYSLLADKESDYNWEREGEPTAYAIMNAADIPEAAADDIQLILGEQYSDFESAAMQEETEYDAEAHYEEKGTDDRTWQEEWHSFERSLKTEARFFSRTAVAHLESVFDGIETMAARDGRRLVVDGGPSTALNTVYRARVFQSDETLIEALRHPDVHLGSPPARLASAGRMNARGISVFYGANDPLVALAEVRPPVGSKVVVASFAITRPLQFLDLTVLNDIHVIGSIFDTAFGRALERAMFLRSLSQRITRPVMPDDEALDFVVTQAIADFLATESASPLDGIIYPSVQTAGDASNVVLFHKAALLEPIDLPVGTRIEASVGYSTEEGWETDYSVTERTPMVSKTVSPDDSMPGIFPFLDSPGSHGTFIHGIDNRKAALRIMLESIEVHSVSKVQYSTEKSSVRRHRSDQRDPKF